MATGYYTMLIFPLLHVCNRVVESRWSYVPRTSSSDSIDVLASAARKAFKSVEVMNTPPELHHFQLF